MANVDGKWNVTVKSPLGDQQATLDVQSAGDNFSGTFSGGMGTSQVNGALSGDTMTWKMDITVPMPMTLDCEAQVSGDNLDGKVTAGAFGSFPLTGTRA
ncbi:hypothetical protein [uncultured Sphingomonas sp.]|jgi:hypothetical protein|uniref:hypothetical protein n=1 Tax=uncultured Sphingomonas sp. TaxID=158754 RepID=UPI0025E15041|nr:hypothetical protein [uncultured Sphingomonas sp.]